MPSFAVFRIITKIAKAHTIEFRNCIVWRNGKTIDPTAPGSMFGSISDVSAKSLNRRKSKLHIVLFVGLHLLNWKHIWFYFPEMVTGFQKKPRTNLEARGPIWRYLVMKWVSNISKKHENRFPPCHVRPNPAKVRGNRIVWSMPCPRTPPDLLNST